MWGWLLHDLLLLFYLLGWHTLCVEAQWFVFVDVVDWDPSSGGLCRPILWFVVYMSCWARYFCFWFGTGVVFYS